MMRTVISVLRRGFLSAEPMPTRHEQRQWAVVFAGAIFLMLGALSVVLAWLVPGSPEAASFLPVAAGISLLTGIVTWQRRPRSRQG